MIIPHRLANIRPNRALNLHAKLPIGLRDYTTIKFHACKT